MCHIFSIWLGLSGHSLLSDYISKVNAKTPLLNTQNSLDIYFMIVKNGIWDEMEEETGKPSSISLKAKVGGKEIRNYFSERKETGCENSAL